MSSEVTSSAVEVLRASTGIPPKLVTDRFINTPLDSAYAVQLELTKLRLNRGDTQIGYKVGCTSKPIQAQMGIHEPIFGRLFETDERTSPQSVNRFEFDGLAVEGELAVELDRDPRDLPETYVELERTISSVFPVIELHHFGNPTDVLNAPVLVANNAIHAGFVKSKDDGTTLQTIPDDLTIRFENMDVASVSFDQLRDTVHGSLLWLREELISRDVTPKLTSPVTVLCGSVAPLFRISEPSVIRVSCDDHEDVRCDVQ